MSNSYNAGTYKFKYIFSDFELNCIKSKSCCGNINKVQILTYK